MLQIISQLAINCIDQAATEAWYAENFGFRRTRSVTLPDGREIIFIKMADSAFYLELFQADGPAPSPQASMDGPTAPGFRHLAFKVNDVDAKLKTMKDVDITLGPLSFDDYIPGWKTVWIRDPDGRIIEISEGFTDA
jgi:glyoxylase I family protein